MQTWDESKGREECADEDEMLSETATELLSYATEYLRLLSRRFNVKIVGQAF